MNRTELTMMKKGGALHPYGDVAWNVFDHIEEKTPIVVSVVQARNSGQHAKLWALAAAVANFDRDFVDAEDAVEWAKLHIPNMHKEYTLRDGRLAIKTRSISWAAMDQTKFGRFYDRALWLWAEKIGCDPESLLAEARGEALWIERAAIERHGGVDGANAEGGRVDRKDS